MVQKIVIWFVALALILVSCKKKTEPEPSGEPCMGEVEYKVPDRYKSWFSMYDTVRHKNVEAFTDDGLTETALLSLNRTSKEYYGYDEKGCTGFSRGPLIGVKLKFYEYGFGCRIMQFADSTILNVEYGLRDKYYNVRNLRVALDRNVPMKVYRLPQVNTAMLTDFSIMDSLQVGDTTYYNLFRLSNPEPDALVNPHDISTFMIDSMAGVVAFELNNGLLWKIRPEP